MPLAYILLLNTVLKGPLLYNGKANGTDHLNSCLKRCAVEFCPGFMYRPQNKSCATFSKIDGKKVDNSTVAYILKLPTNDIELNGKCVENNFSAYGLFK